MSLPRLRITSDGESARDATLYVNDQLVPGVLSFTLSVDCNGQGAERFALLDLRMIVKVEDVDLPARVSPELLALMRGESDEPSRFVPVEDVA